MTEPNLKPAILYYIPAGIKVELPREMPSATPPGAHGPDGGKGVLCSPYPNAVLQYAPELQRWRVTPNGYHIGHWRDYDPQDFARHSQFGGYQVALTDDKEWLIPIANPLYDSSALPFTEVRDPATGEWTKEVKDQYKALADYAIEIAGKFRQGIIDRTCEMAFNGVEEIRSLFCQILGLNYDLTPEEIEALRLLDPRTYDDVLRAFVDFPVMMELMLASVEEANAENPTEATPGGSDTPAGEQDTSQTTNPQQSMSG